MIAIVADIHGNLPALQAVLKELKQDNISLIYSLGDVAGYYPLINECIELLKENEIMHILGNHDNYLVNNVVCARSTKVNQSIEYQRSVITNENLLWLSSAPLFLVNDLFFMVHGGIKDYLEEYSNLSEIDIEQDMFFCGHTHIQQYITDGTKHFCNPGAVGQPRDRDSRAAYAVIDDVGRIVLRRVSYSISSIADAT